METHPGIRRLFAGGFGRAASLCAGTPFPHRLLTAVELCQASGVFSLLASFLTPVTGWLGIPSEVMPLFFLRPFSGGGSTALVDSVLRSSGPDSPAGLIASVMMGSSETTFYAISVYYGSIHGKVDAGVWPARPIRGCYGSGRSLFVVLVFVISLSVPGGGTGKS